MLPGIICKHITRPGTVGKPVLRIVHDEPAFEEDSGCGLYCGALEHQQEDFLMVNLDRILDQDPALREVLQGLEEGSQATRADLAQPWLVEPLPEDDDQAAA